MHQTGNLLKPLESGVCPVTYVYGQEKVLFPGFKMLHMLLQFFSPLRVKTTAVVTDGMCLSEVGL